MDAWTHAISLLPEDYRVCLSAYPEREAEEIRLRTGRMPTLLYDGKEHRFSERLCRERDLLCVLERASGASIHAVSDAMRDGYLTSCGVRIGVCGSAAADAASGSFQNYSSLALRIPHECRGIGRELMPLLRENLSAGTLILSPPGGGKTTLLRELIRVLSDGGLRVGIADERNELSASEQSKAGFDLGAHSDVIVGMPKAEAAMLLLRAMNPQLIAMDEITRAEDAEAAAQVMGCGIGILAAVHAASPRQMRIRPIYRELLESGFFTLAVCIAGQGTTRHYRWERIEA